VSTIAREKRAQRSFLKSRKDVIGFPTGIANCGCRDIAHANSGETFCCRTKPAPLPHLPRTLTQGIDQLGSHAWPMKAERIELPTGDAWEHFALHNFEGCAAPNSKLRLATSLTFGKG
jgi:hypothetical protein